MSFFRSTRVKRYWLVTVALLLCLPGIWLVATAQTTFHTQKVQPKAAAPSPYIWGTNVVTKVTTDAFLADAKIQKAAQQIHIRMVRFPDRHDATLYKLTAQKVKQLGMMPLVILPYNNLDLDKQLVNDMNVIFGTSIVYYEFGNERDGSWFGPRQSPSDYTKSWNSIIPILKKLAKNGRFVGPVNYHADPAYVGYFVAHAVPQADAVSWHEYTCANKDSNQSCLNAIDLWTQHIRDTRTAMQKAIGKTLPIIISEWNWNAIAEDLKVIPDKRMQDTAFISQWTQKALNTLVANQIFASMQYAICNYPGLSMIDEKTHVLTGQAKTFQTSYEHYIGTK